MRLLEKFSSLVKNCSEDGYRLKAAWLTTFNLSPAFVETFILPMLVGKPELRPRNFIQFEELATDLRDLEKTAFIEVFHDGSVGVDGLKKTPLKMNPIFVNKGLFHPKVSVLVFTPDDQNKPDLAFAMVGSANLTVDGWGRNREAVLIEQIETVKQKKAIEALFRNHCNRPFFHLGSIKARQHNPEDWELIVTGKKKKFSQLAPNGRKQWTVWSPYFSTPEHFESVQKDLKAEEIRVIPDLVESKIRMTKLPSMPLYADAALIGVAEKMVHAKVWLSESELIVGSHNFTKQALNGSNVEVSILKPLPDDSEADLVQSLSLRKLEKIEPMSDSELSENKMPEQVYGFGLSVSANHEKRTIEVRLYGVQALGLETIDLLLPGAVSQRVHLGETTKDDEPLSLSLDLKELAKFWKTLATEKSVEAEGFRANSASGKGKRLFAKCFVTESGLKSRVAFEYANFSDLLLDALAGYEGKTKNSTEFGSARLKHVSEALGLEEMGDNVAGSIDYLTLFKFLAAFKQEIESVKKDRALQELIWFRPASLLRIRELIESMEQGLIDPTLNREGSVSTIFVSVLKNEFNDLLRLSQKQIKRLSAQSLQCESTAPSTVIGGSVQSNETNKNAEVDEVGKLAFNQIGLNRVQMRFIKQANKLEKALWA